jgi:phosphoesterase RecJ-like protein
METITPSTLSPLLPPIRDFLSRHRRYLVLGHVEPDGDCVASQLVFVRLLARMGQSAAAFSLGPFDRPEIAPFAPRFRNSFEPEDLRGDPAVVVVDCSTAERIGDLYLQVRDLPTLVVDHHAAGREFGQLRLIDPQAPSVTYILLQLLEALGMPLEEEDARLVLFGLCTDTGFFRHLGAGSAPVFRAVARLVEAGITPHEMYRMIYGDQELGRYRLLGQALARTRSYFGGRLLFTWETLEDQEGVRSRGSDELYRMLLNVQGVEVVALVREESKEACSVGLRSAGGLDVGALAHAYGGGGHRQAAGFTLNARVEEIEELIVRELAASLGEGPKRAGEL